MYETRDDLDDDQRAILAAWEDMTEAQRSELWWWIQYLLERGGHE
jgi:hypothetical protein